MQQRGNKTLTSSGGPGEQNNKKLHPDCPRFNEWTDPTSDPDTEVSHLVRASGKIKNYQKRCCKTSSSGYSSHSPPLSGSHYSARTTSGIHKGLSHHHHHHPTNCIASGHLNQQINSGLAAIHEAETIPRPIWPFMDLRDIQKGGDSSRCDMIDCEIAAAHAAHHHARSVTCKQNYYSSCGYCCACSSYGYRDTGETTTGSSARQVLLELSRTLNSVIEAESDLSAEEILRDISITVARGIHHQPNVTTSGICDDYTYRLSSSSSSGGKESSVGVNPVNLRVYGKPKWLNVPASRSSQCPYEGKTLLTAAQKASRTIPAFGNSTRFAPPRKNADITPSVFLVPQANSIYPCTFGAYRNKQDSRVDCESRKQEIGAASDFNSELKRTPIDRLNVPENCDKCPEPVYSTQLDGSESSSYDAIGDPKPGWESSKVMFDRHLDFTLDGNRAERLGRAIAKAKRKRQWCRGLTAIFGLVFFILSVVVVSLSVTRGRKVFGSMSKFKDEKKMVCLPCVVVPILLLFWRFLIQPLIMKLWQYRMKDKPEGEKEQPPELVKKCENGVCTLAWNKTTPKTDKVE